MRLPRSDGIFACCYIGERPIDLLTRHLFMPLVKNTQYQSYEHTANRMNMADIEIPKQCKAGVVVNEGPDFKVEVQMVDVPEPGNDIVVASSIETPH